MTFGDRVRQIRKEKGISQKTLGKKLGVRQQTIAQYEKIQNTPKFETVCRIADALGVPCSLLLKDLNPTEKGELLKLDLIDIVKNLNLEITDITDKRTTEEAVFKAAEKKRLYIKLYDQLNTPGQDKAIEQVEILTKVPEYRKDPQD